MSEIWKHVLVGRRQRSPKREIIAWASRQTSRTLPVRILSPLDDGSPQLGEVTVPKVFSSSLTLSFSISLIDSSVVPVKRWHFSQIRS